MVQEADVIVIGGGIAGASVAGELSRDVKVVLLEREDQPGYHSTGRSAALFSEAYGPEIIRRLSCATRSWLENPPEGTTQSPLLSELGVLWLARTGEERLLEEFISETRRTGASVKALQEASILKLLPILKPGQFVGAAYEVDAKSMDVNAIHQVWLRLMKRQGGRIECKAEVTGLARRHGTWTVSTADGRTFKAPLVVNAAGAWADVVAGMAGVRPIGLVPKRRTVVTVDLPPGVDASGWPLTGDIAHTFYFKRDSGRLIVSPADETPVEPQDIQPDEYDIAVAIDRFEQATTVQVRRPGRCWAGLRCFVEDRLPVVGFAPDAEGFFWLAGQGGYGIQTCAGLARTAAALVRGKPLPASVTEFGITAEAISPRRLAKPERLKAAE